jgi:AraC-like DNA-binding protein
MSQTQRYSTAPLAPKDRFAYWREAVCDSFVQLGCEAPRTSDFSGNLDIARYAQLSISKVSGARHSVERRNRDIRAATQAYFLLSLQMEGGSRVSQFGNIAVLRPGDMAIYDSTQPYRLDLDDGFAKTVLQLPQDQILARLPNAQMMGGMRIDGQSGIGKLVRENILAFSHHMDAGNPTMEAMLQNTLIDLIATGLASGIGSFADLSSPEQHILLRARSYIVAHLGDPDLDRTQIAEALGMSVRRLNGIFAKEGTSISEVVRKKRLDAVASALGDPRFAAMTISEIAVSNGFCNLQHFSNLFSSTFYCSPRAYRAGESTPLRLASG